MVTQAVPLQLSIRRTFMPGYPLLSVSVIFARPQMRQVSQSVPSRVLSSRRSETYFANTIYSTSPLVGKQFGLLACMQSESPG